MSHLSGLLAHLRFGGHRNAIDLRVVLVDDLLGDVAEVNHEVFRALEVVDQL